MKAADAFVPKRTIENHECETTARPPNVQYDHRDVAHPVTVEIACYLIQIIVRHRLPLSAKPAFIRWTSSSQPQS